MKATVAAIRKYHIIIEELGSLTTTSSLTTHCHSMETNVVCPQDGDSGL